MSDTDVQIVEATKIVIEENRITITAETKTTIRIISANLDPNHKGMQFLGRPASVTNAHSALCRSLFEINSKFASGCRFGMRRPRISLIFESEIYNLIGNWSVRFSSGTPNTNNLNQQFDANTRRLVSTWHFASPEVSFGKRICSNGAITVRLSQWPNRVKILIL